MLRWLAENNELLIALFGAGGAGAVILTAIAKKRTEGGAAPKPPGIKVNAADGGIAAGHTGHGNIEVHVNRAVELKTITGLENLGLSLTETALLLKVFHAARMGESEQDVAISMISTNAEMHEALISALRTKNVPGAAAIVARAAVVDRPLTDGAAHKTK